MSLDFSVVAAGCAAASVAVRYNEERREAESIRQLPRALPDSAARVRHDQTARDA